MLSIRRDRFGGLADRGRLETAVATPRSASSAQLLLDLDYNGSGVFDPGIHATLPMAESRATSPS